MSFSLNLRHWRFISSDTHVVNQWMRPFSCVISLWCLGKLKRLQQCVLRGMGPAYTRSASNQLCLITDTFSCTSDLTLVATPFSKWFLFVLWQPLKVVVVTSASCCPERVMSWNVLRCTPTGWDLYGACPEPQARAHLPHCASEAFGERDCKRCVAVF